MKKRSKKLLHVWARHFPRPAQSRKSFLVLFFKKERPPFLPRCPPRRTSPIRKTILLAALLASTPAAAETDVLHYTARLHGIPLLDINLCLILDKESYEAGLTARTVGLIDVLVHGRAAGHVEGAIDGTQVKPRSYDEHGRLSGEAHHVVIDYPGGNPVVRSMEPPQDESRLPIPAADLPGSIDGLSAIVLETVVATRTSACQGGALVFDGLQLRRATTQTTGQETLAKTPRSVFAGNALRCDTTSVMVAGFMKDDPVARQARPRHSRGWLAPLTAGGPAMPIRLVFDADMLGDVVVDLDAVSHSRTLICDGKDAP